MGLDESERERERTKILATEMNIDLYEVEPEMETVLTDFHIPPYPTPFEIAEEKKVVLPLMYYDNDDGFWDEYIDRKYQKWGQTPMLINRKFYKH